MRTFNFIATIALFAGATLLWISESHAQSWQAQGWPQTTSTDPRFSVEFGAKAYDRPGDDLGLPLITDGVTNSVLFDSDAATDLGSSAGAEVKFNFMNRIGRELEIRTIIADWEELTSIQGGNLVSPFFPVAGQEPTSVQYGYSADYFSIELMARRAVRPGVTLMFGPRFVSTKDLIELAGSQVVNGATISQTQTIEATNALIGLQGGVEFNYPITQSMYINGFGRFGGYTNPTEVTTGTTDIMGNVSGGTQTKATGSFLGEVGGRLYIDIFPNALSVYVGYEATWIDGLALAPAQVLTTGLNGVETANTPFFNAATIGLKWTY